MGHANTYHVTGVCNNYEPGGGWNFRVVCQNLLAPSWQWQSQSSRRGRVRGPPEI